MKRTPERLRAGVLSQCRAVVVVLAAIGISSYSQELPDVAGISGRDLLLHVKFLASPEMRGRDTFSPEQLIAGNYIALQFERYGLRPVGDRGTHFQEIVSKHAKVTQPSALEVDGRSLAEGRDYDVVAVGSNSLDTSVVFVGYGVTTRGYDSYAGVDVRGKIVLLFEGNFPGKGGSLISLPQLLIGNAIQHGASGMIFVRGTSPRNKKREIESELSVASLTFPIAAALKIGLCQWSDDVWKKWYSFPFLYVAEEVGDTLLTRTGETTQMLKRKIDASGKPMSFPLSCRVKLQAGVHVESRRTMNVVGLIEGRDPVLRKQVVIVGAHYDHISIAKDSVGIPCGADDNASGTAVVIEVARALAGCQQKPRRSVLFIAFTGEERSLIGSHYYVEHPIFPLSETVAMLNLDMVGRNDPDRIKMVSSGGIKGLGTITERSATDVGLTVEPFEDVGGSDQAAFVLRDVPIVWLFDGGGDFIHGSEDTWEKISAQKLEKVARFCFLSTYRIADYPAVAE